MSTIPLPIKTSEGNAKPSIQSTKLSAHLKDSELIQALREGIQDEPSSNMSQYITKLLKAQLALGE
ncbi:hypothetical protein C4G51_RS18590 [Vibrio parahaemolyticus]|nr:hypothetical protein [Vibrio parahaemolyticus]